MKKIFISMMAIGAFSLAMTFGVKTYNQMGNSSLLKSNVEALTEDESNGNGCWLQIGYMPGVWTMYCGTCSVIPGMPTGSSVGSC